VDDSSAFSGTKKVGDDMKKVHIGFLRERKMCQGGSHSGIHMPGQGC
jgi:hypothetical protein